MPGHKTKIYKLIDYIKTVGCCLFHFIILDNPWHNDRTKEKKAFKPSPKLIQIQQKKELLKTENRSKTRLRQKEKKRK